MKKRNLLILLMLFTVILGACSNYKFKPTISYEVNDFTATNQHGEELSLADLKGKPWLAMFIFTNCKTICSPMTNNMAEIQDRLVEQGVEDYNIVAFSVDPENDTPEVLGAYLDRYGVADESKWQLVTGYDQKFIEQFGLNSFKTFIKKVEGEDQITHMNTFYLVDATGTAVKNYSGYTETEEGVSYDTIAIDLETLIEEQAK
ncbi:SCO family protein [Metasolibacillus sp.]|uniref:SCO family protein n=1 Tax=Metasolibacillus sp. TaxID=2703680 RepID=UPI0025FC88C0|nr:SCO family protein [Metasolibacillus sp.]MCT6922922.1 SCO family protein [Metasolibacillus sp.]MCT6939160.1 SCO family protein [Metasolibacillus sp.]